MANEVLQPIILHSLLEVLGDVVQLVGAAGHDGHGGAGVEQAGHVLGANCFDLRRGDTHDAFEVEAAH